MTDNVLLRRGSDQRLTAKLIDFGCASWTENPIGFNCGEGASNHIAPEVRKGKVVTTATDVYSMGRLLEDVCRVYKPVSRGLSSIIRTATKAKPNNRQSLAIMIQGLKADLTSEVRT
ncbi:Hypp6120 [Branchiostoma lanceolatum]|uniref:Hypp6120 protein n=1 Tax=Branchiostoma lanceolatum TaxID=7740 RepID=A0A8J9YRV4_BRALA|nr:Hypp6120 [Branchiostoma lanceolatum]